MTTLGALLQVCAMRVPAEELDRQLPAMLQGLLLWAEDSKKQVPPQDQAGPGAACAQVALVLCASDWVAEEASRTTMPVLKLPRKAAAAAAASSKSTCFGVCQAH